MFPSLFLHVFSVDNHSESSSFPDFYLDFKLQFLQSSFFVFIIFLASLLRNMCSSSHLLLVVLDIIFLLHFWLMLRHFSSNCFLFLSLLFLLFVSSLLVLFVWLFPIYPQSFNQIIIKFFFNFHWCHSLYYLLTLSCLRH